MAIKIIDHGSKEYDQMIELRKSVLRKPLGLTYSTEDLERDKNDLLIGAFEEDDILACCILTQKEPGTFQLRQMAVDQKMQRNGVGAAIMHFAENLAKDAGGKEVMMHARKTAMGFYEKLGYAAVGDEFSEVGIPHVEMKKNLI
jgi:predicted GNAT family N-acyltransferase